MVIRFNGGANLTTKRKKTTMLNTNDKIIKHKTGLLNLSEELGNASKACQVMGYSRDTFYRYKNAVEDGGVEALLERTRASQTWRTVWMKRPKMLSSITQLSFQRMVRCAHQTNYAKLVYLSLPLVFVPSGCVIDLRNVFFVTKLDVQI